MSTGNGHQRSAKGRFAKCNTVSKAENARAQVVCRKRRKHDDELLDAAPGEKKRCTFVWQGRRAVHMTTLAQALSKCKNPACGKPLVLADCVKEARFGLASVLSIPCRHCAYVNEVDTDSRVETAQRQGPRPFSSNRKAALGMLDAGVGETHVNSILTALDMHAVSHKTLKKSERSVGTALEEKARESCRKHLEAECQQTQRTVDATVAAPSPAANPITTSCSAPLTPSTLSKYKRRLAEGYNIPDAPYDAWKASQLSNVKTVGEATQEELTCDHERESRGSVGITVSYDMGWSKRGKAMNSMTGVGVNIGAKTGKIVGYATRSKRCVTCDVAERQKRSPKPHSCRRNHYGSSKSMEPAVAVQLAKDMEKQGAYVACLIGDDDASTIKRLVEEIGSVTKQSDIGHCKRGPGAKLYEAKSSIKECKQLTGTVIAYFQKMFAYALQDNADDAESLRATLLAITPHAYGNHEQCNAKWCGYLKAPATYHHHGLPHGKDLTCSRTQAVVSELFQGLAAQAEKLAPLGSSQANESFNNVATSKAPKSRHYGGSDSQDFRMAAAVLQKNEGHTYIAEATAAASLSPSGQALSRGTRTDKARAKQKAVAATRVGKLRRKALRERRGKSQETLELREGVTYQSSCTLGRDDASLDTEEVPAPLCKPHTVALPYHPDRSVIVFDLETTSLARTAQITQIAARLQGSSVDFFSQYLLPTEPIARGASAATGLSVVYERGVRQLAKKGGVVESCSQKEGLERFIAWMEQMGRSAVLVAHNCHSFDMRVLVNAVQREGLLDDFQEFVDGFADSLPL